MEGHGSRTRRTLERVAGGLFLVAAAAHGGLAPQHVAGGPYGLGLLGVAGLEALWGLAMATRALESGSLADRPATLRTAQRGLLGLGIGVAAAGLLLHLAVPAAGALDGLARVAEAGVIPVLAACWWLGADAAGPDASPRA